MRASVVIGASGGIGRAIASRLLEAGEQVHALARSPVELPGAFTHDPLDIADENSIARVAAAVGDAGPIDLVIVATGLLQDDEITPEKSIRALDAGALSRLFSINAIGPMLVAKHFLPLLPRRGRSVFAAMSARVGSISDNRLGGWYGYRASKAALNQFLRTAAIEVARTRPDTIVLGLHPGTVATVLSRPFRTKDDAGVVEPEVAADRLLYVIDRAARKNSGSVLDWAGRTVPA